LTFFFELAIFKPVKKMRPEAECLFPSPGFRLSLICLIINKLNKNFKAFIRLRATADHLLQLLKRFKNP